MQSSYVVGHTEVPIFPLLKDLQIPIRNAQDSSSFSFGNITKYDKMKIGITSWDKHLSQPLNFVYFKHNLSWKNHDCLHIVERKLDRNIEYVLSS